MYISCRGCDRNCSAGQLRYPDKRFSLLNNPPTRRVRACRTPRLSSNLQIFLSSFLIFFLSYPRGKVYLPLYRPPGLQPENLFRTRTSLEPPFSNAKLNFASILGAPMPNRICFSTQTEFPGSDTY